ncbi:hypothetical protein ACFFQF_10610 [Haladaptatus pallidirubidus]
MAASAIDSARRGLSEPSKSERRTGTFKCGTDSGIRRDRGSHR